MFLINSRNKINDKFFNDSDKVDLDYIRQIMTFCKPFLR